MAAPTSSGRTPSWATQTLRLRCRACPSRRQPDIFPHAAYMRQLHLLQSASAGGCMHAAAPQSSIKDGEEGCGGPGHARARAQVGDKIEAVSASFGTDVWEAKNFGQVMYAIKTRNGDVYLKFQRMFGDTSALMVRSAPPCSSSPPAPARRHISPAWGCWEQRTRQGAGFACSGHRRRGMEWGAWRVKRAATGYCQVRLGAGGIHSVQQ